MMMQMQAAMLDLMPTTVKSNSNSGPPKAVAANYSLRFDQLLGQARTTLASICQESGQVAAINGEAELVNGQEEDLARKGFGVLAALLAQSSLTALASQLPRDDAEAVAATGETVQAPELSEGVPRNMITEHNSAQVQADTAVADPSLQQLLMDVESISRRQAEPVSTSQQGVMIAETGSLAELLEQLRAEVPEVFSNRSGQTSTDVRPERWGQLERYWLLREPNDAKPELQQAVLDPELGSPEIVVAEKGQSLRTATEALTEEATMPIVSKLAADGVVQVEEGKQSNQFAAYLDVVVDNVTVSDIAEPADVSYTARPGTPLEQQLEQGLAVGLRQLRLLRSPDGITVRMQLYPESLGEVRVELKLVGNMLTAQLRALQPQATEALRLELPLLRENLVNQGFTHVFLGAETAEHFGHSAGREQQRFQEEQARRPQRVGIVKTETIEELEQEQLTKGLDYRL